MANLERFLSRLDRPRALLLVALLWAAIYLPVLGTLEIKGEEGRRILPAVAMLDTGDWIVPHIGGEPYFSKPPLINWCIAASFRLTGIRNEWAARAPSVLAVLALGLTTVLALARWLGTSGALLCAVFLLTNIGLMEKGRLIEIEALYLGLFGMALLGWLAGWRRDAMSGRTPLFPWRTWTLPWIFLGLGLLTKGPLHLVYFYGVVAGVLLCSGRWRDFFNWAHLVGVVLMLGIFAAWAVPYLHQISPSQATGKWYAQMAGRAEVTDKFQLGDWLLNGPRGLVNFLPWVVLLPLAWKAASRSASIKEESLSTETRLDFAVARGLRWALAVPFLVVSLAPGGIPRYTLPLLVPACVLLALAFTRLLPHRAAGRGTPSRWPTALPLVWEKMLVVGLWLVIVAAPVAAYLGGRAGMRWGLALTVATVAAYLLRRLRRLRTFAEASIPPVPLPHILPLTLASGVLMALITADYATGAVQLIRRHESVRPIGHAICRAVPEDQRIGVLRADFLPLLFYVRNPVYLQTIDVLPGSLHFLFIRESDLAETENSLSRQGLSRRILFRGKDKRVGKSGRSAWLLLGLDQAGEPGL